MNRNDWGGRLYNPLRRQRPQVNPGNSDEGILKPYPGEQETTPGYEDAGIIPTKSANGYQPGILISPIPPVVQPNRETYPVKDEKSKENTQSPKNVDYEDYGEGKEETVTDESVVRDKLVI